jgi:hypothetical protein
MKSMLIAIPTYKRFDHLLIQLSRLKELISRTVHLKIDVLVQDNDDDENIKDLVLKFGFKYQPNPTNLGADSNMIMCFYACVDYDLFWLLSDDDYINSNLIKKIFLMSSMEGIDLIVLQNKNTRLGNFSRSLEYNLSNLDEFMDLGTGLISSVIYNVHSIVSYFDELIEYWHTGFPHLRLQISLLRSSGVKIEAYTGDFFDDTRMTTLTDSLGYKKALYGFLGLFEDMSKDVRIRMAKKWWKSIKQRYLAVRWRHHSRRSFVLWKDFMTRNLFLFPLRFYFFMIFFYPFGRVLESNKNHPFVRKILLQLSR